MNLLSGETPPEIYGGNHPVGGLGGRPSTSLQQLSPRQHTMVTSGGCGGGNNNRNALKSDVCYDDRGLTNQGLNLDACGGGGGGGGGVVNDMSEDAYNSLQSKKSPPSNGKKTKGRVKIKMEYIENKLRRYTTFSKRKTGIMKKVRLSLNLSVFFLFLVPNYRVSRHFFFSFLFGFTKRT